MPGFREDKRQPTNEELGRLRDQIELFLQNEIWLGIVAYMQRIYADAAEQALNNPGDTIAVAKASGMAEAVKMITNFPAGIEVFSRALGAQNGGRQ